MNKYNEIYNAMIEAMKSKNTTERDVLREVIANIKKAAIDKGCKDQYDNELVNNVLLKEKKTVQEMLDSCPINRQDLFTQYLARREIINKFAHTIISNSDVIEQMIKEICTDIEFTMSNKGLIMKNISSSLKGKVDMKVASQVVSTLINRGNK